MCTLLCSHDLIQLVNSRELVICIYIYFFFLQNTPFISQTTRHYLFARQLQNRQCFFFCILCTFAHLSVPKCVLFFAWTLSPNSNHNNNVLISTSECQQAADFSTYQLVFSTHFAWYRSILPSLCCACNRNYDLCIFTLLLLSPTKAEAACCLHVCVCS